MTKREEKLLADLTEAAANAIGYFNMKAQAQDTGLNKSDDDLRQQLCNAVSASKGQVVCGNLQRTHEAQQAIDNLRNMTSAATDTMPQLQAIGFMGGDQLNIIAALIPFLQYRSMAARDYEQAPNPDKLGYIRAINTKIQELLYII